MYTEFGENRELRLHWPRSEEKIATIEIIDSETGDSMVERIRLHDAMNLIHTLKASFGMSESCRG